MSRKLLTLRYDGTAYHGWQVQKNAITVQQVLQDALEQLYTTRPDVCGCSRTDSGVHADMFCCHFDPPYDIPNEGIILGLNRYLPDDIGVYGCDDVADDFHARYSCKNKTYVYKISVSKYKNPFTLRYSYHYKKDIDLQKANEFCKNILGEHDFTAFSSADRTTEDTVRTVLSASVDKVGDTVKFKITANGFLYNMVRILAGTIIAVSEGKIAPDDAEKIINSKNRALAGATAPANGLTLLEVNYE